ncbi:hypothetical protein BZA77DRAFT_314847 [Pyronema omphalodes]|nr:hypothetical protein BZA77DRAFT_314847 [Pyronema omphalodes]
MRTLEALGSLGVLGALRTIPCYTPHDAPRFLACLSCSYLAATWQRLAYDYRLPITEDTICSLLPGVLQLTLPYLTYALFPSQAKTS